MLKLGGSELLITKNGKECETNLGYTYRPVNNISQLTYNTTEA
mgnify:CR=1 FL=1